MQITTLRPINPGLKLRRKTSKKRIEIQKERREMEGLIGVWSCAIRESWLIFDTRKWARNRSENPYGFPNDSSFSWLTISQRQRELWCFGGCRWLKRERSIHNTNWATIWIPFNQFNIIILTGSAGPILRLLEISLPSFLNNFEALALSLHAEHKFLPTCLSTLSSTDKD